MGKLQILENSNWIKKKINELLNRTTTNENNITALNSNLEKIGEKLVSTASNIAIKHGVTTKATSLTLPKGLYIVDCSVKFSGNSNGMRAIVLSSASSVDASKVIADGTNSNPWGGISTRVRYTSVVEYEEETTLCLYAYQNSNSDLIMESAGMSATRLK